MSCKECRYSQYERLERACIAQHGVVTTQQARSLGLSPQYLARSPRWDLFAPGVYRLGAHPGTWRQRLMAATLAGGDGAVVSHRAAAVLWGLDGLYQELVEITIQPERDSRSLGKDSRSLGKDSRSLGKDSRSLGKDSRSQPDTRSVGKVIVHRSMQLNRVDISKVDHIPLTTVTRTLIDLGAVVERRTLESALESALRSGRTSLRDIARRLAVLGGKGRPGTAMLRAVLAERMGAAPTGSELETRFFQLCDKGKLPVPARQYEVVTPGATFVCDFAFVPARLLVELDGYATHSSPTDVRNDQRRQNAILLARPGWTLLRFSWDDVVNRPKVVIESLNDAIKRTTTGSRPATTGLKRTTTGSRPATTGIKRTTTGSRPATTGLKRTTTGL